MFCYCVPQNDGEKPYLLTLSINQKLKKTSALPLS